jgi:hypothetical protein
MIAFPGNNVNGKVAPAIFDLVESGTIRLIYLLFIRKDAASVVSVLAIAKPRSKLRTSMHDSRCTPTLDSEEADEFSEHLAPNTSSLMVAIENN